MKKHYEALDGLRGLAALGVLLFHIGDRFASRFLCPHGYLAVDFFFVLSGFVIAEAYDVRLRTSLGLWDFIKMRVKRLWPVIAFGTLLGAAGAVLKWRLIGTPSLILIAEASAAALFVAPLVRFPESRWPFPINPPAWSLFYEGLINLAYAATIRLLPPRALFAVAGASAAALVIFTIKGVAIENATGLTPMAFARVGFSFTAGLLLNRWRSRAVMPTWAAAGVLAAILCIPHSSADPIVELAAIFVAFPLILAGSVNAAGGMLARLSGRISYPLYATHYWQIPIFSHWGRSHALSGGKLWALFAVEAAVALVVAFAALKFDDFVQAWFRRRDRRDGGDRQRGVAA